MDAATKKKLNSTSIDYSRFDSIDGDHPLKNQTDNSYIEYPARVREGDLSHAFKPHFVLHGRGSPQRQEAMASGTRGPEARPGDDGGEGQRAR